MRQGWGVSKPYRQTQANNFASYNSKNRSLLNESQTTPTKDKPKYHPMTARIDNKRVVGTYQPKNNFKAVQPKKETPSSQFSSFGGHPVPPKKQVARPARNVAYTPQQKILVTSSSSNVGAAGAARGGESTG